MAEESGGARASAAPRRGGPAPAARVPRALARSARAALLAERPYETLAPRARTEALRIETALGTLTRPEGRPEPSAELLAAFRAGAVRDARRTDTGATAATARVRGGRRARLLAAGVLSLGMVGGVAVAGGTGALTSFPGRPSFPKTVQPRDPGTAPAGPATPPGLVPGATSLPDPAGELLAPGPRSPESPASPSPSPTRPGPRASSGTATACRAHARGHVERAVERRLVALAGGTERVDAYCEALLRGGMPGPGPTLSAPAPATPSLTLPDLPTTYPTFGFEEPSGSPSPTPSSPGSSPEEPGGDSPTRGPHETSPSPPVDDPPPSGELPAPSDSPDPSAPPAEDVPDLP
ncbi:hypothetical protein [Streptomyces sp. CA-253872]|uniref:hypothetical protein n=1 Tax=Streptomyces sp. CA-253872 TaxID=3240067 RepID=UPI003D914CB0